MRRARQYDIGMFGQRVPAPFMYNHRVGFLPCCQKPLQILMMVEWITTCPVNKPDIRIGIATAIINKVGFRFQKHLRNTRNGDEIFNRILTLR